MMYISRNIALHLAGENVKLSNDELQKVKEFLELNNLEIPVDFSSKNLRYSWRDTQWMQNCEISGNYGPCFCVTVLCNRPLFIMCHIKTLKAGDLIEHNGELKTVSGSYLKKHPDGEITVFGDSYQLGYKLVKKVWNWG